MTIKPFYVFGALFLLIFGLFVLRLFGGEPALNIPALLQGDALEQTILLHFRAPRVLLALLVGGSLGMAGSMSQTMLRNPLASPDIIGFSAGASVGAAAAILMFGHITAAPFGALAGGIIAAILIMVLAWKDGLSPLALVLIGIALNLMFMTGTDILLSLSPAILATELTRYLTGSFVSADWPTIALITVAFLICGCVLVCFSNAVDKLESGDDLAISLGLRPNRIRFITTLAIALLISVSVAAAGPIPFIAFLAGPIARKLSGQPGTVIFLSTVVGACLALGADVLATLSIEGTRLPAGVYTALFGAPVMLILLFKMEGDRK